MHHSRTPTRVVASLLLLAGRAWVQAALQGRGSSVSGRFAVGVGPVVDCGGGELLPSPMPGPSSAGLLVGGLAWGTYRRRA